MWSTKRSKDLKCSLKFVHSEGINDLVVDSATIVSISCVHSYCNTCYHVLCFTCSSCSMITDERIHSYCRNINIVNSNNSVQMVQKINKASTEMVHHNL